MTVKLVEIEPGRFVVDKPRAPPARSALPCPHVISDAMSALEHVDGKFYESKSSFRAVTRAHGLTEIGTEKQKPRVRASTQTSTKLARRASIKKAVEKYRAGHRVRRDT